MGTAVLSHILPDSLTNSGPGITLWQLFHLKDILSSQGP